MKLLKVHLDLVRKEEDATEAAERANCIFCFILVCAFMTRKPICHLILSYKRCFCADIFIFAMPLFYEAFTFREFIVIGMNVNVNVNMNKWNSFFSEGLDLRKKNWYYLIILFENIFMKFGWMTGSWMSLKHFPLSHFSNVSSSSYLIFRINISALESILLILSKNLNVNYIVTIIIRAL